MKEIKRLQEKWDGGSCYNSTSDIDFVRKINELVDAVNELKHYQSILFSARRLDEQTQEPECEHKWFGDDKNGYFCGECGVKEKPAKKDCKHKEPESNHKLKDSFTPDVLKEMRKEGYPSGYSKDDCQKCGHDKHGSKECMNAECKDDLAERLINKAFLPSHTFAMLAANEARKWILEIIDCEVDRDELISRLKGEK